ncbi:hypothetical protein VUR80DRAFT_3019 [Thermomyces stellatus]
MEPLRTPSTPQTSPIILPTFHRTKHSHSRKPRDKAVENAQYPESVDNESSAFNSKSLSPSLSPPHAYWLADNRYVCRFTYSAAHIDRSVLIDLVLTLREQVLGINAEDEPIMAPGNAASNNRDSR